MTPVTEAELAVIDHLIREAEDTAAQLARVLGDGEPAEAMRFTRDWLRAIRDAGTWITT